MGTKHKHAEVIKAWADGEDVEVFAGGGWHSSPNPMWIDAATYRVKPKSPIILYRSIRLSEDNNTICLYHEDDQSEADLVFKFDPNNRLFIDVELLK